MADGKTPTRPELWGRIVSRMKASSKGSPPGEWSARSAQLALLAYKKAGGGWKKTALGGSRGSAPMRNWG